VHDDVRQMLSAYLDGELVQADDQRVRIHLEDCAGCREELRQLETLQQAASTTRFARPTEVEMGQSDKQMSVRAPRLAGWALLLAGAVLWVGYGLYMFITNPVELTLGNLIAGATVIGVALLFVSVLQQRLLELPQDRYRGVKK
jgi:anti-sigma factor RsiW